MQQKKKGGDLGLLKSKIKFDRFDFMISKNDFYIFPAVEIIRNDMFLNKPNIAIQAHWFSLHFRCRWIGEERNERNKY